MTTEKMSDRYEKIRDALAMGPTPGHRRVIDGDSYPYVTVALPENEGRRWNDPVICALFEDVTADDYIGFGPCLEAFPNASANAALIAACDPDTVQALLEERDALRAALVRILENEAPDRKAAEELGGYVLDDELREEARAAIEKATGQQKEK